MNKRYYIAYGSNLNIYQMRESAARLQELSERRLCRIMNCCLRAVKQVRT